MKKFASILLIICMTIGMAGIGIYTGTERAFAYSSSQFSMTEGDVYSTFTNYVDGYTLKIDKGMNVDMRFSGVATILENETKRIEIYKQYIGNTGKNGYINYSNKFLANTNDHVLEYQGVQKFGKYDVNIVTWHREKLDRVQNDLNYYICMDIPYGKYCYTITMKANRPIYQLGGYTYLLENFNTFEPTAFAYMRKSVAADVDEKNWNKETKDFYNKYLGNEAELSWGIFEPDTSGFVYTTLDGYEKFFDYEFPVILNYSEFDNKHKHPDLEKRLSMAYDKGKVLELTLQTRWQEGGNMVYDVLEGQYDSFLTNYAKSIAEFEHPVMFRLGNEMNGDWCPYSGYNTARDPYVFKNFYKYIYSIFEENGANKNTIWIWNPNCKSFPDFNWNNEMMYYPGDKYVDVVGLTAYNTGTYYASTGERWTEFETLYSQLYSEYCAKYSQPLMITEFSSASMGGDKNQWIINMFNTINKYNRIKLAIWWDGCDWDANGNVARSYFIDETPTIMETFKRYLKEPWYRDIYA